MKIIIQKITKRKFFRADFDNDSRYNKLDWNSDIPLGIAAACSNMLGNYIGSGLVMTKGSQIAKPLIITMLALLLAKIILGF